MIKKIHKKQGGKMKDYKKRMVSEYQELKERADKLSVILNRYYLDSLKFELSCPIELLQAQWHAMCAYLKILEQRAEIEGVSFDD